MPRPKGFKSSFSSVFLVPSEYHRHLMSCLENVHKDDVNRLNQNGIDEKIGSISDSDGLSMPPVVKLPSSPSKPGEVETSNNDATGTSTGFEVDDGIDDRKQDTEATQTDSNINDVGIQTASKDFANTLMQTEKPKVSENFTQTVPKKFADAYIQTDPSSKMVESATQTDEQKYFTCEKCSGMFVSKNALEKHVELFHKKKVTEESRSKNVKNGQKTKTVVKSRVSIAGRKRSSNSKIDGKMEPKNPSLRGKKRDFLEIDKDSESGNENMDGAIKVKSVMSGDEEIVDLPKKYTRKKSKMLQKGSGVEDLKKSWLLNKSPAKSVKNNCKSVSFKKWL